MAANTGKYFGNNFVKGWKKSFDIKGNTNYADYSSFLGFNFGLILVLSFLTWKVSEAYFFCLIIYLFADIFPMTSITLRRLIDSGNSRKNIFWLFLPFIGWWKLRKKLSNPTLGEKDIYEGMKHLEKKVSDFFLKFLPALAYKVPFSIPILVLIMPILVIFGILASIAIPSFYRISNDIKNNISMTESARNALTSINIQCSKYSNKKKVLNSFNNINLDGYYITPTNYSCNGDSRNLVTAVSTDTNKIPTYSINIITGKKSCFYSGSGETFACDNKENLEWLEKK